MKKIIFTTNSNHNLAKILTAKTGFRFGKRDIKKFIDKEIFVHVRENIKGKIVYVLGSSFPPSDNILELLMLLHALKVNGAKKIILIIPYFAYAKGDHIDPRGTALAAKLMAEAYELAGASETIAINLHSKKVENFFKKKLTHLSVVKLLADYFNKRKIKNLAVASPDSGGTVRAKLFAKELGINKIITVKKYRPSFDKAKVSKISGEVKEKNIIIIDDMIQSGDTVIKAAKALKKKGAKDIYVAVAHLVFSGPSVSRLAKEKAIKHVIITDTIPSKITLPAKFKQLSVVDLISNEIIGKVKDNLHEK